MVSPETGMDRGGVGCAVDKAGVNLVVLVGDHGGVKCAGWQ